MLAILSLFMILLGAALGSFANVVIIRLKSQESLMGRSHCVFCKRTLNVLDLVPVLSWVFLRGKCRSCQKAIHWQYPVVETTMAVLTLVAFLRYLENPSGNFWTLGFEIALIFVLLVLTVFDLRWKLIPMEFLIASTIVLSIWRFLLGVHWLQIVLGAFALAFVLGLIVFVSRGMLMGDGDPYVGLFMGSVLGFPLSFIGLLLSFIIGGSVAAALLIQGSVTRKTQVPFVPFLAAGTIIAYWWSVPLELIFRYAFF